MTKCGNCGKLLPSDESGRESQEEERWNQVLSTSHSPEPVEAGVPNLDASSKDFKLASLVLVAALIFLVLSFALEVYSAEKAEDALEGLLSGDLGDMMGTLEDIENTAEVAKWAGYLSSIGLILLAAGLVGLAVGLSKRLK
ncbi:MAG: hypothetical protein LN409_02025 [Candidatus Thermoplasmatota archaeon]|nr:hypothetical protein [Candidatus Thermoplasmatota archaeon]